MDKDKKIFVLGQYGRMGRRYTAILKWLGHAVDGWDVTEVGKSHTPNIGRLCPSLRNYTHVIIATPTDIHADLMTQCCQSGVPYVLCEKPMCMDYRRAKQLAEVVSHSQTDVRVVCNWAYVREGVVLTARSHRIRYSNWYTGPHSDDWNLIQIHYLDKTGRAMVSLGPRFECRIDGSDVTLADIDNSYIRMLSTWLSSPHQLWGMEDVMAQELLISKMGEAR